MVKPEVSINKIEASSSSPPSSSTLSPQNKKTMKKFKGVRMRSWGSYVSEVRAPNQKTRIWLGSYSTPEAAARAYDAALLCLKGSSANLNFPLSSYKLQEFPPNTLSPKSIQKLAALAAANPNTNFLDNATTTTTTNVQESSPSSSTSSPSLSHSDSSNQVIEEDLFQLAIAELDSYVPMVEETMWCHFESPKYLEMLSLVNGPFFDQAMTISDDSYEEGDINLWNFC